MTVLTFRKKVHGFRWVEERDLSGFVDGTENPAGEETRREVAVIQGWRGCRRQLQRICSRWEHKP